MNPQAISKGDPYEQAGVVSNPETNVVRRFQEVNLRVMRENAVRSWGFDPDKRPQEIIRVATMTMVIDEWGA
jgi:hypothetical protein